MNDEVETPLHERPSSAWYLPVGGLAIGLAGVAGPGWAGLAVFAMFLASGAFLWTASRGARWPLWEVGVSLVLGVSAVLFAFLHDADSSGPVQAKQGSGATATPTPTATSPSPRASSPTESRAPARTSAASASAATSEIVGPAAPTHELEKGRSVEFFDGKVSVALQENYGSAVTLSIATDQSDCHKYARLGDRYYVDGSDSDAEGPSITYRVTIKDLDEKKVVARVELLLDVRSFNSATLC